MQKSSNIRAKISFFGPKPSVTNGLGGSTLGLATSNRGRSCKNKPRLNRNLHLLCDICFNFFDNEHKKPYLIVPCGHPICMRCSQAMNTNKCPTCRKMISQKVINWGLLVYMQELLLSTINNGQTFTDNRTCVRPRSRPKTGVSQTPSKIFVNQKSLNKHNWSVLCLKQLPRDRFASGSLDNSIKIWGLSESCFECIYTLVGHTESVNCLELLSDYRLASGSNDGSIKIWNLNSFTCEAILVTQKNPVNVIRLLPDNNSFVSSSQNIVQIWDTLTLKCLKTLQVHSDCVSGIEIVNYGQSLATASWDRTIKIFDLKDFNPDATLVAHTGPIKCLCGITNNRLASGSDDKSIRIWELESLVCSQVFYGHTSSVNCLLLMPNNRLASGSSDWSIRIWSLSEFYCIGILNRHCYGVNCLENLPDNSLISGSNDWSIKVWTEE